VTAAAAAASGGMAALIRIYAGGTRQRKITPRATKPWPDADTHRLCAHGAVEHRSLQPASNRAKRACAASCSPPRMQWRVGALQGRKGDKRPAPRAEAARTTRAPEQVECAGFESPLKNWGAPRRHVDSGSPGGRQNDLSWAIFTIVQLAMSACRLVGNATNPPTVVNGVHYGSLGCQWTALLACFLML